MLFRSQSDFLPKICQHVTNNIVRYKDGYLAFVIRMSGIPFDGVDDKHLFAQFVSLRTLLAGMGKTLGNRLAIWGTLQRQKINFDRKYEFDSVFCQKFAEKYLKRFQNEEVVQLMQYHQTHVVNVSMGLKYAAMEYRYNDRFFHFLP